MLKSVEHLTHASLLIKNNRNIYIDPFNIKFETHNADIILCTHSHYDHFSIKDINKVLCKNTILVVTEDCDTKDLEEKVSTVVKVKPYQAYKFNEIIVRTVPAYNNDKKFHPKENNWVGYLIDDGGTRYYVAGDTDLIDEMEDIEEIDVVFLPVGGTYTMDFNQAAQAANILKPKVAVPIHFDSIVGTFNDAKEFCKLVDKGIETDILLDR